MPPSSDEKVRISKFIPEMLLKSSFFFNVLYYFKSNSYVKYCLSDEKVRISKNHSRFFVKIKFLCCLIIWIEFLCIKLFKWWKSDDFKNHYWNFVQGDFLCFLLFWIEFLCIIILFKLWKSEDFKNHSWSFVQIDFLCFLSFRIEFLCIEKVRISKIFLEILLKIEFLFFLLF